MKYLKTHGFKLDDLPSVDPDGPSERYTDILDLRRGEESVGRVDETSIDELETGFRKKGNIDIEVVDAERKGKRLCEILEAVNF